ncbi:MFS transporter [Streptomyces sp. NPDC046860]|uniref:MFS transporter n=1 Tax=Streptomyces sp. NPDC046860 TaxID=3154495 RepID=UPI003404AF32
MSAGAVPRHALHTAGLLRSIYIPRTASALAAAMSTYGIPLLVLATTHSTTLTGLAFALEWVPRLAAFGWAGSLVDRRGASVISFLASSARALALAAGAVLLHLHPSGAAAAATVMVLATVTGGLTEFSYIAAETAGAAAGRRAGTGAHRVQAVLLGIDQSANLAGPALAGLLLLTGPPNMLAVITVLSGVAALLALRTPPSPGAPTRAAKDTPSAGLLTGLRTIRRLPTLGWLVAGLTLSNLAISLLQAAGPVLVVHLYGQSTTAASLVWSAAAGATLLSATLCRFVIDRVGLWPVGAACALLASLACLAVARAPDYRSYAALVAVLMAADGGMTVVLRTLRSHLIPEETFGSTLSATILILLLPAPVAGVLTALTPTDALGHVIAACAVLQALGLLFTFTRLRADPILRT